MKCFPCVYIITTVCCILPGIQLIDRSLFWIRHCDSRSVACGEGDAYPDVFLLQIARYCTLNVGLEICVVTMVL